MLENYKKIKSTIFFLTIAALFTPFLINKATYFPFIITKATVFRVLIETMFVLWVFWLLVYNKERLKISPLFKAVLIYGLIIFVSALFGINFTGVCFLETREWKECLGFGILFCFLLF